MPGRERGVRAAAWVGLLAAFLLVFYVIAYPIRNASVGIGSDTPFYTWWTRHAGLEGLGSVGRARPGIVGLLASLTGALGLQASWVAAAVAPVLATTTALAMGAFLQASVRPDRVALGLAVAFTGAFLSLLVPGWLSTLAFGTLFLGALACLAGGLATGDLRRPVAAAVLLGAAGLMHPVFLLLAAAVLAGGMALLLPALRRDLRAGVPFSRTAFGRALGVAGGGAAIAGAGVGAAALTAGPSPGGDISRDAAVRRIGLPLLAANSFRVKLGADFPLYRAATFIGLALTPLFGLRRRRRDGRPLSARLRQVLLGLDEERALFWGVTMTWLLVTVAGVAALLIGIPAPGQRLAVFCLALPVLAALGLVGLRERLRATRPRVAAPTLAVGALLFLGVAWLGWIGQQILIEPPGVRQAKLGADALASTPPGTPLVLVADSAWPRPAFEIVRFRNFLRAAVPGARVPDVHVFPGSVDDFLEGRPTLTGNEEHDRLSRTYLEEVRSELPGGALVVALEWFDPVAHEDLLRAGGRTLGPGAVALVIGEPGGPVSDDPALAEPGRDLFSPWLPVWLAPLLLVALAGVGWTWAGLALPGSAVAFRASLAPAFGAAAVAVAAIAVDAAGLRLARGGAPVAVGLAAVLPLIVIATSRAGRPKPSGRDGGP